MHRVGIRNASMYLHRYTILLKYLRIAHEYCSDVLYMKLYIIAIYIYLQCSYYINAHCI